MYNSTMWEIALILQQVTFNFISIYGNGMRDVLVEDVMARYSSTDSQLTMPVTHLNESLQVTMALQHRQLTSLDSDTGRGVLEVLVHQSWQDGRLSWTPSLYNNISSVTLPYTSIWRPQLALINGYLKNYFNPNAIVDYHGNVKMITPMTITVTCNTGEHPNVICLLPFHWLPYGVNQVDPHVDYNMNSLDEYVPHADWSVVETGMTGCCGVGRLTFLIDFKWEGCRFFC